MSEGQSWTFADSNSTFVDADNCVYQLVSVQSDEDQLNGYSNLEFLKDKQFAFTESLTSNAIDQIGDSENILKREKLFQDSDQVNNQENSCKMSSLMLGDNENDNSNFLLNELSVEDQMCNGVHESVESEFLKPVTVIQAEDLKNELYGSGIDENLQYKSLDDVDTPKNEYNEEDTAYVENKADELDADVNIELPKEPSELLDTLTPMLETNGGLKKNMQESFLKIMRSCDPMPLQCLLINIIRTSQGGVLKRLLSMGGFSQLHKWLEEARSQINKPLMLELLQLFKLLPVNTKLLRTNSCAKDIKQLIKNNDERISRFARVIVDDWMKIVSGSAAKPKEKSKSSDKKITRPEDSPPKPIKSELKEKIESPEVHNQTAKSLSPPSISNDDKAVKKERPKTVKRRQYTFRMTGDNKIGVLNDGEQPSVIVSFGILWELY